MGDTIVDGWPQFECNCNVFASMIASTCQPVQNLSTALSARDWHVLYRVIVWELSCTCIVKSWSQRRRPNMVVLPITEGRLAMLKHEHLLSKFNVNEMKSMYNLSKRWPAVSVSDLCGTLTLLIMALLTSWQNNVEPPGASYIYCHSWTTV